MSVKRCSTSKKQFFVTETALCVSKKPDLQGIKTDNKHYDCSLSLSSYHNIAKQLL